MSTTVLSDTVTYDRSSKIYSVVISATGEVLRRPSRGELEFAYLEAIAPTLADQVVTIGQRHPRLCDRARRAGLIVAAQGVQPGRGRQPIRVPFNPTEWTDEEVARVKGSGYCEAPNGQVVGRDWYSVTDNGTGALQCNCEDFTEQSAPEILTVKGIARMCKHVIAFLMAEEI